MGNAHLTVPHRMSSFWVFLRMLARQEGCEDFLLKSIDVVSLMQTCTMDTQDDLAPIFKSVRERPDKEYLNKWMSADVWSEVLKRHAPLGGLPLQLDKLISSAARLSNRMAQAKDRLGIEVRREGRVKEFRLLPTRDGAAHT